MLTPSIDTFHRSALAYIHSQIAAARTVPAFRSAADQIPAPPGRSALPHHRQAKCNIRTSANGHRTVLKSLQPDNGAREAPRSRHFRNQHGHIERHFQAIAP